MDQRSRCSSVNTLDRGGSACGVVQGGLRWIRAVRIVSLRAQESDRTDEGKAAP